MDNGQLAVLGLDSVQPESVKWSMVRKGKGVVDRMAFGQSGESASAIKARLKASGLKGKALVAKVNECLRGGRQSSMLAAVAMTQSLCMSGFVPDYTEKKDGVRASMAFKFVSEPVEASKPVVKVPTEDEALAITAAAWGVTVEAMKVLKASMAAKA